MRHHHLQQCNTQPEHPRHIPPSRKHPSCLLSSPILRPQPLRTPDNTQLHPRRPRAPSSWQHPEPPIRLRINTNIPRQPPQQRAPLLDPPERPLRRAQPAHILRFPHPTAIPNRERTQMPQQTRRSRHEHAQHRGSDERRRPGRDGVRPEGEGGVRAGEAHCLEREEEEDPGGGARDGDGGVVEEVLQGDVEEGWEGGECCGRRTGVSLLCCWGGRGGKG